MPAIRACLIALCLLILGCIPASASSYGGQNGLIAYWSNRDGGDLEVYLANADGSNERRLTTSPGLDAYPMWNADGSRMAWTTSAGGDREIVVADHDGANPVTITSNTSHEASPHWSPDGSRIAFDTDRDGNLEIYTMRADGTDVQRLTSVAGTDRMPVYSPDGTKIAFASTRSGNSEIYVMNVDGSNVRRLTTNPLSDYEPRFSPDGNSIVYNVILGPSTYELWMMDADGTNQRRISAPGAFDFDPVFAPDGERLLFATRRDGNYEIYSSALDGSDPVRLTNTAAFEATPAWQPLPPAPVSTSLPTIDGQIVIGSDLTIVAGTWTSANPSSTTVRWQRCAADGSACVDIAGASGATYTLRLEDARATIRVIELRTNLGGTTEAASAPTSVVPPPEIVPQAGSVTDAQGQPIALGAWTASGITTNVTMAVDGVSLTATDAVWIEAVPTGDSFGSACGTPGGSVFTGSAGTSTVVARGLRTDTRYQWRACVVQSGFPSPWSAPLGTFGVDDSPPTVSVQDLARRPYVRTSRRIVPTTIASGAPVVRVEAWFRGRRAESTSGSIDPRLLPEGRGTLIVRAVDALGQVGETRVAFVNDRSGPRLRLPRFVVEPTASGLVSDALTGVRGSSVRVRVPRHGLNVIRGVVRDRAGNATRFTSNVVRRISLARAGGNTGIFVTSAAGRRFEPLVDPVDATFRYRSVGAPWYGHLDVSPPIVREAQWRLARLGYLPLVSRLSGRLDLRTIEAVKSYQRDRGIPAIATIGPLTRAALDRDVIRIR